MEINQINNRKIKYNIGNASLKLLIDNNFINHEELKNVVLEYGYLFSKEDGNLEALLKISCIQKIYYFAFQKGKLMLVNINERQYVETIEYMKNNHECLKNDDIIETEKEKTRRLKNNQYLINNNITINENMACLFKDENVKLKSLDEICKRAITCLLTVQIACDINNNYYKESLEYFKPLYKKYNVENNFNSKELRIINGSYSMQDAIDMDWAYEAYWALCWCLGLVDDIKDASKLCDCNKAIDFVIKTSSLDEFKTKCKLRSIYEILEMHDLYFRYNWAINNKKIDQKTSIGNLNPSNVIERRRALEWVLSEIDDWYQLPLYA